MRLGRVLGILLIAICLMGSDPPRGWNALSDPDEGYSFNYPQEFRLKRTSDMTKRDLADPKIDASLELVVMDLDKAPSFQTFSASQPNQSVFVVEQTPLFIITTVWLEDRTVYRKLLLGKTKAYLLTASYKNVADQKVSTQNKNTALRILKSLRRIG